MTKKWWPPAHVVLSFALLFNIAMLIWRVTLLESRLQTLRIKVTTAQEQLIEMSKIDTDILETMMENMRTQRMIIDKLNAGGPKKKTPPVAYYKWQGGMEPDKK